MRNIYTILAALILVMAATTAQAGVITLQGALGSDAVTLEQAWLATVTVNAQSGFESPLAPNQVDTGSGIALSIGTLTGFGHVGSSATYMKTWDEHAVEGTQYWSNAAPNTAYAKGSFTLNLNAGSDAIGFYGIDFHDVGGQVQLTVNTLSGSQTVNLFSDVSIMNSATPGTGVLASGTDAYFVVIADEQITSVTFHQSGGDGFGIDGVTTASTPIPAAAWLLGSGLVGMIGFRRMRG